MATNGVKALTSRIGHVTLAAGTRCVWEGPIYVYPLVVNFYRNLTNACVRGFAASISR